VTLLERVESDLCKRDYGLARVRLANHIASKGYDAELIRRLGQISFDMHDHFEAGRCWLMTPGKESHINAAIEEFVRRCNRDPSQIASQIPQWMRMRVFAEYPEEVQARLKSYGLESSIIRREPRRPREPTWEDTRIGHVVIMSLLIFVLICFGVGVWVTIQGCNEIRRHLF